MDPATLIGLVIAFGAVITSIFLEGASPMSVILPAPMMLVIGGTLGAGLIGSTLKDAIFAFTTLPKAMLFKPPKTEEAVDTLVSLADRGRIANAKRGDLFLSIHVNAANPNWREPARARGFETYFLAEAKTEEESRVERMENESVRFETGANARKGDPLSFIINDMAQNEHLRESNELAGAIQRSLGAVHPGPSRGVRQANFAVLRTSFMPAVLIELGFGTNPAEADYLNAGASQTRIAESIAAATVDYLSRYDRRVGASSP